MAQYTQDYYLVTIDVKTFLTENPSATWREVMRDCICVGLQENFNADCEYTEVPYSSSVNYPAIRIPWHDGSTTNMPILVLSADATSAVTSSVKTIVFHTSELGGKNYDIIVECGSYGAGSGGSLQINTSTGKLFVGAVREDDMMHIGFWTAAASANPNSVYMNTIMTKMKDRRTNTDKHALIASYLNDVRDVYYDYVKIMIEGETAWTHWYPSTIQNYDSSSSTYRRSGIALISPIDIGTHYHETLYVYPRTCSTLYGEWDTNTSFYASTPEQPWYENAFVVDGVSWDVKRHSANGSSGGFAFSICKKHVDANEEV